ncbi:hypothetical protein BOTBODRAFT_185213 [Botryobasidium botryosum FD-172 SS1]|uniref:Aromatic-L-amino-acid decarboxylase n=1 Tax=Botryobasidium botryosum (strain FD-172 SS1) TaxID=930990 RepID=A0A067MVF8_BOTB1|nr:hypothetical protein BOTBODRAFT_185213 [Botryobasidium botryosum FD-172 SS1]
MDIKKFREAGYAAIDKICDYYGSLETKPVIAQVEPGWLSKALPTEAPQKGEPFERVEEDFQKLILPGITHWQHPSFFAYFPSPVTFEGILGDLYSSSLSNPGFNWICSPACTELESVVMDWAAKLFGLQEEFHVASGKGGGVIMSTASEAALTALVAARSRFQTKYPDVPLEKLVIYGTTQTHIMGKKAAAILGLQFRPLKVIKGDNYSLRGKVLKKALEEDQRKGLKPFGLIATIGTTSSGAIDNVEEIGQILRDYPDIWLHVDAAWAGVVLSCPEYRDVAQLPAINKYATSFCTNFHKWGLVNFDASTLWVRERTDLTNALDLTPEYLRTKHGDSGAVIDYRNWQLPLGRKFRALKIWFVLRGFGVEGFQAHIRKGIKLAQLFADHLQLPSNVSPRFELVTPVSFSLVVFRLLPPGDRSEMATEEINELNKAYFARLSARSDSIFLVQTLLDDIFCIRFAVGAERTGPEHIGGAWKIIKEEAEGALEEWSKSTAKARL